MFVTIIIGILLGCLRVAGIKGIFFQAIAHLFMGGLAVAWWEQRTRWQLWLFIFLTVLETVCFFFGTLN